jgi:hypothetical protein
MRLFFILTLVTAISSAFAAGYPRNPADTARVDGQQVRLVVEIWQNAMPSVVLDFDTPSAPAGVYAIARLVDTRGQAVDVPAVLTELWLVKDQKVLWYYTPTEARTANDRNPYEALMARGGPALPDGMMVNAYARLTYGKQTLTLVHKGALVQHAH